MRGLTVIEVDRRKSVCASQAKERPTGRAAVLVRCECGEEHLLFTYDFRWGLHHGCLSCAGTRRTKLPRRTHGLSRHPLYKTWSAMVRRCTEPTAHNWRWYGGRGITVHPEWIAGPATFLAYVGANLPPREPGHTLDRIDNNRGYEPGNLRWSTRVEQMRNTRATRRAA